MKKILSLLLLLFFAVNAYCQQVHFIKFIYEGSETKPIGTLIISVEKLIKPTDRDIDAIFGKSIKTNINTFNCVRNFISTSNYTVLYNIDLLHDGFKIVCSDGRTYYLYKSNRDKFYISLQSILKKKNMDKRVIHVFTVYQVKAFY